VQIQFNGIAVMIQQIGRESEKSGNKQKSNRVGFRFKIGGCH